MIFKVEGVEAKMEWEVRDSRYKLLYITDSTGNYIQYLMINHNGKEY